MKCYASLHSTDPTASDVSGEITYAGCTRVPFELLEKYPSLFPSKYTKRLSLWRRLRLWIRKLNTR